MNTQAVIEKILQRAHPAAGIVLGASVLVGMHLATGFLGRLTVREQRFHLELERVLEQAAAAKERAVSHQMLKALDFEQFKAGLSGNALSQKSLFESGLSLQEERRLLEKQLEIITTSLLINPALQRIFLMRAEQPMQSYLISYIPLKAFGGAATSLPAALRITAKERFAHPERGKAEQVNGTLQWTPPQVGTSLRSKALGEFVMFTSSSLILHGTPVSDEDHARFPHVCLGLHTDAARRLYRASFIGTKIALHNITIDAAPAPAAVELLPGATQ